MKILQNSWTSTEKRDKNASAQGIMDATQILPIAEKGYDPQFGTRPVKRVIQRDILNELSKKFYLEKITDSIVLIDAFEKLVLEIKQNGFLI
jgi:ATP-dependent Clp protease ATP-binding subunit ClpB